MEQTDYANLGIGTKERTSLKPSNVKIAGFEIQTNKKDGTKMKSPLVHINVKHPEKEELISLSKITYLLDNRLVVKGLWVNLDEDGLIQKSSALDILLKQIGCETLKDIAGKDIETVAESKDSKFLCLKAY